MSGPQLFCLPYAGGSAAMYYGWKKLAPWEVEICPVEYAGRGTRFGEPLFDRMEDMLNDLSQQVLSRLNGSPFALFGHSMGAILAFELAYRLKEAYGAAPAHLFVSGQSAPHVKERLKETHTLPLNEFLAEVTDIGGTPPSFFEEPLLQDLFVPVLRADFKIVETYRFVEKPAPLECGVTVYSGTRDDGIQGEPLDWGKHTSKHASHYEYEGDHFFIREHERAIVDNVSRHLLGKDNRQPTSF